MGFLCTEAKALDYHPSDAQYFRSLLSRGYRVHQQVSGSALATAITCQLIRQGVKAKCQGVRYYNHLTKTYSNIEWFILVPR